MFKERTVFILGAGASWHYGYLRLVFGRHSSIQFRYRGRGGCAGCAIVDCTGRRVHYGVPHFVGQCHAGPVHAKSSLGINYLLYCYHDRPVGDFRLGIR